MPQPTDEQLVTALLDATRNMSLRERQRATGISHATFDRLTRGQESPDGWTYLQRRTREAAIRYLERAGRMPAPVPAEGLSDTQRLRLLELVEEMARVLRGEG